MFVCIGAQFTLLQISTIKVSISTCLPHVEKVICIASFVCSVFAGERANTKSPPAPLICFSPWMFSQSPLLREFWPSHAGFLFWSLLLSPSFKLWLLFINAELFFLPAHQCKFFSHYLEFPSHVRHTQTPHHPPPLPPQSALGKQGESKALCIFCLVSYRAKKILFVSITSGFRCQTHRLVRNWSWITKNAIVFFRSGFFIVEVDLIHQYMIFRVRLCPCLLQECVFDSISSISEYNQVLAHKVLGWFEKFRVD